MCLTLNKYVYMIKIWDWDVQSTSKDIFKIREPYSII